MAYPDYLNKGTASLDAANWEQSLGFADNAKLVIEDSFATLSALDRTADYTPTTGGIDYLWFLGGSPIVGADNGVLKVGFEGVTTSGGYTAAPNLIWATNGGVLHLEMLGAVANHDANLFNLIGKGDAYLHAGRVTDLFVGLAQFAKVLGSFDVASRLIVSGRGASVHLEYSADALPSLFVSQLGGSVLCERNVSTEIVQAGGSVEFADESTVPLWSVYGGTAKPLQGTVTQMDWYGGELDFSSTRRPVTITTLNNRSGKPIPSVPSNVTITSVGDDFSAILAGGGAVSL